jgi:ribosomal protein S18 acetylase RimI-like enzyme
MGDATLPREPTEVRRAAPRDVATLVGVLSRAFDADPFYNWLLPQDARRASSFKAIFELILAEMSEGLRETFTTSDVGGAAIWLSPGMHKLSLFRQAQLLPAFSRILGWRNIPRGLRILEHMDALHARFAPEPHFYLSVLGVDPSQQGRGLGSQLLEPMLARCDRDRYRVYLETARAENLPFYERHGFQTQALTEHADFPTFWSMTRAAR